MGQVRHGSATTTYAVRAAIQRSQASRAQLSREFGINPKTVAKWRKVGAAFNQQWRKIPWQVTANTASFISATSPLLRVV